MKYHKIESQEQLEKLISSVDWTDAFVREMSVVSRSYVVALTRAVVAASSFAHVRLLILTPNEAHPGIEWIFEDAEDISLPIRVDLKPEGRVTDDRIEFMLNRSLSGRIIAKKMFYAITGKECWGNELRYSRETPFQED